MSGPPLATVGSVAARASCPPARRASAIEVVATILVLTSSSSSTMTTSVTALSAGSGPWTTDSTRSASSAPQAVSAPLGRRQSFGGDAHCAHLSRRRMASRMRSGSSVPSLAARSSASSVVVSWPGSSNTSHPARSANTAASATSCPASAPADARASDTIRLSYLSCCRSSHCSISRDKVAGTPLESSDVYATCAVIMLATPAAIAARNVCRS